MKLSLTPALGFSGAPSAETERPNAARRARPRGRPGTIVNPVRPLTPSSASTSSADR